MTFIEDRLDFNSQILELYLFIFDHDYDYG